AQQTVAATQSHPAAAIVTATADAAYVRQRAMRDLDPPLRDFVTAYAGRRPTLGIAYRTTLAESARGGLSRALPQVVAEHGPLAALDQLADYAVGVPDAAPLAPPGYLPPPLG
ncbi:MAG TPA: hypothetical protein VGR61_00510, partial [Candidatus Dormibacteraeota bacterium]|nr:hypothetical protein [Candidatus Dormibacteraeota bacterium]